MHKPKTSLVDVDCHNIYKKTRMTHSEENYYRNNVTFVGAFFAATTFHQNKAAR